MPMTEKQWAAFARELRRAVARVAPEWTDDNAHDPGITVLEVVSYAISDLQHRGGALDDHALALASSVAEQAGALARSAPSHANDDCGPGLQRVNYFGGRMLGADDFNTEQAYLRGRLRRRNLLLHGTGIASGLGVTVARDAGGSRMAIAPGLALDAAGNELCVEQTIHLALPTQGSSLLVLLRYAERPCGFAPVMADPAGAGSGDLTATRPSRIVETFSVALSATPAPDAVVLARLRPTRGGWRVDPRFKATRLGER